MGKLRLFLLSLGTLSSLLGYSELAISDQPATGTTAGLTGSSAAGFLPTSFWDSTKPPAWNASQGQQMANIFTSCSNFTAPLQSLASGMMAGLGGGMAGPTCPLAAGVTLSTVCPGSDQPINTQGLDCAIVLTNPTAINQAKAQIEAAMCTVQCKKAKSQAIQGEAACLSQQANLLTQQVGTLTQSYTSNIQRMATDVQTIKSTMADREAQIADVNSKLNGDNGSGGSGGGGSGGASGSGTPGLLALRSQTQAMVNQMPADVQTIRTADQQVVQEQKALDEQIQLRDMSLTMNCFNSRPVDSYQCVPNGPPVSAKDYLICRFQQNQTVGANGVVERNSTLNSEANSKAQGLSTLLTQIAGDASTQSQIPTTPEDQQAGYNQPLLVLTVADIQSRYGSTLANYKLGGTDANQFVMATMKACNARANAETNLEQSRVNTAIGSSLYTIRNHQQTATTQTTALFSKYNQQYQANMQGLTGTSASLNTSACNSATPMVQVQCLEGVHTTMEGLLMGTSANSAMTIQIKGNNPSTYVNFTCQGLNGCVTSMQNVSRNLGVEKTKLVNFQKQYILQANQSAEAYTKNIATTMSTQSQQLNNRLKALNTAMASIGGGGGFNIPAVKGEEFKFDEDGLIKPPNSALNLIGQYVNPPLPDVSGDSFSGAMSAIASSEQQLDGNYAQLSSSLIQINNIGPGCAMSSNRERILQVTNQMQNAQDCSADQRGYCNEKFAEVQSAMDRINALPNSHQYAGQLQSGVMAACTETNTGQFNDKQKGYFEVQQAQNQRGCAAFFSSLINVSKSLEGSQQNGTNHYGAGSAR
jgi:hypothetical protein